MAAMLSPADLAALLNVPVRSVYRWRSESTGPRGIKVGKHVRYRQADVDAWLDQQADQRSRPAVHGRNAVQVRTSAHVSARRGRAG